MVELIFWVVLNCCISLVVFLILFLFFFIICIWLFRFIKLVVICSNIEKWDFVLGKKISVWLCVFFLCRKGVNICLWDFIFCDILKFCLVIFWLLKVSEGIMCIFFEKILKYWCIIVMFRCFNWLRKYVLEGLIIIYFFCLNMLILCFNSWFWGVRIII